MTFAERRVMPGAGRARPKRGPARRRSNDMAVWKPILGRAAILWLPVAAAVTGISVMVYGVALTQLRSSADDPQIQMVEEAVASLDAGATPTSVVPAGSVDMATSLRPYLVVFDRSGRAISGSVSLHGGAPDFPASVFQGLSGSAQDRITWQPQPGMRSAVVVEAWRRGYVLARRSLRLTEERQLNMELIVAVGWLGTVGIAALTATLVGIFHPLPGSPAPGGSPAPPPGPVNGRRRPARAAVAADLRDGAE